MRFGMRSLASLLLVGLATVVVHAQRNLREITPVGRNASEQERLSYMVSSVGEYGLTHLGKNEPIPFVETPLLRWSNPVSGIPDGIVVLWAREGIPEVVAQVFLSRTDLWLHEFQSLTRGDLLLERTSTGEELWQPRNSVVRQPIPNAPVPDEKSFRRSLQMKELARRFSARVMFKPDFRKQEFKPYELRLQPRPIYRYEHEAEGIVDGALFAFVQGTNPEVFLIIEAVHREDGVEFHYGLSPMTAYVVSAKIDGQEIWKVPQQSRPFPIHGAFYFRQHQLAEGDD